MKKVLIFIMGLVMACCLVVTPSATTKDSTSATLTKSAEISGNGTSGVVQDRANYYFAGKSWSFDFLGYSGNANANLNYLSVSIDTSAGSTTKTRSYTARFTNSSYQSVYGYGSNTWTATSSYIY